MSKDTFSALIPRGLVAVPRSCRQEAFQAMRGQHEVIAASHGHQNFRSTLFAVRETCEANFR